MRMRAACGMKGVPEKKNKRAREEEEDKEGNDDYDYYSSTNASSSDSASSSSSSSSTSPRKKKRRRSSHRKVKQQTEDGKKRLRTMRSGGGPTEEEFAATAASHPSPPSCSKHQQRDRCIVSSSVTLPASPTVAAITRNRHSHRRGIRHHHHRHRKQGGNSKRHRHKREDDEAEEAARYHSSSESSYSSSSSSSSAPPTHHRLSSLPILGDPEPSLPRRRHKPIAMHARCERAEVKDEDDDNGTKRKFTKVDVRADDDLRKIAPLPVMAFIQSCVRQKACGHCAECKKPPCGKCRACHQNSKVATIRSARDKRRCEALTCIRFTATTACARTSVSSSAMVLPSGGGIVAASNPEGLSRQLAELGSVLAKMNRQYPKDWDDAEYEKLLERKKALHVLHARFSAVATTAKTKKLARTSMPIGFSDAYGVVAALERSRSKFAKFATKVTVTENSRTIAKKREMRDVLDQMISNFCTVFGELLAPTDRPEVYWELLSKTRGDDSGATRKAICAARTTIDRIGLPEEKTEVPIVAKEEEETTEKVQVGEEVNKTVTTTTTELQQQQSKITDQQTVTKSDDDMTIDVVS